MQITNPYIPDSYLPHLEAMNYPYFEEEWIRTRDNLGKEYAKYTLGKYIAKMNLKAYKPFTWEDNESIKELIDSKPKLFFNELEKLRRTKMTTTEFLEMYDSGEEFSSVNLENIFYEEGDFFEDSEFAWCEDMIVHEMQRWNHVEQKVLRIGEEARYFLITGYIGNTEYQENIFDCQPVEVREVEKVVKAWEAIE